VVADDLRAIVQALRSCLSETEICSSFSSATVDSKHSLRYGYKRSKTRSSRVMFSIRVAISVASVGSSD
jgi:hypothetical protein